MTMRIFLIGVWTAILCLGVSGMALASENNDGSHARAVSSEAGDWQYNFDSKGSMSSHSSMMTRQSSDESYNQVSTEAGDWQYNFDQPDTTTRGKVAEGSEYRMPKCSEC
ncbi:MAG: hypothetical protein ACWGOL_03600 [Desulfuromonadales bacterium]